MKITDIDHKYLKGEAFSNAYYMRLTGNLLYDRNSMILQLTSKKRVMHVGACDHIPLIEGKIANGTWLHKLLDNNCSDVVGIDINDEAVRFVNSRGYSKKKMICADLTTDTIPIDMSKVDVILLGEIVEHVDNPVSFLHGLKRNVESQGFCGEYLITVPNAISMVRTGILENGMECINSDHRFYYTPYTISKVMTQAGMTPNEILFTSFGKGGNGKNRYTNRLFMILETIVGRPSAYKSWRGDQIIAVGR